MIIDDVSTWTVPVDSLCSMSLEKVPTDTLSPLKQFPANTLSLWFAGNSFKWNNVSVETFPNDMPNKYVSIGTVRFDAN